MSKRSILLIGELSTMYENNTAAVKVGNEVSSCSFIKSEVK